MSIEDKVRAVESSLSVEERSAQILNHHREIATTLLALMDSINAQLPQEQYDPNGWRIYAFDPITTTQEQVMAVPGGISGPAAPIEPLFEIDLYPSQENARGELRPTSLSIHPINYPYNRYETAHLALYPMGTTDREWTELSVSMRGQLQTHDSEVPEVKSIVNLSVPDHALRRNDDVFTSGVSVTRIPEALGYAERTFAQAADMVRGLQEGRFRARIFGNTHSTPMRPLFIAPRVQLPPAK